MPSRPSSLPQRLHTTTQTRALEQSIIASGTNSIALMKRAARAALASLRKHWPNAEKITVFCGSGGNGGDGYLLAALVAEQALPVQIFATTSIENLKGDARVAAGYARSAGVSISLWSADIALPEQGVIVDALLGIGSTGTPRAPITDVIRAINTSTLPVLALDVPSGLNADNGCAAPETVHASVTITFICAKSGLFTGDAANYCGQLEYADLSVSPELLGQTEYACERLCLADLLKQYLPKRPRTAHKGLFGHVLVVGGDYGMGGAVILASEAAARTGAGLISVATRCEHIAAVLARRPEIMALGVNSGQTLAPLLPKASVLAVGPGLGRSAWSEQMLQQATLCDKPLVLDADALNMLAEGRVVRQPKSENWVLTPHPGEAARLLGCTTSAINADRFAAVTAIQKRYGGVAVLKGAGTLIADGINTTLCDKGNPGMASGGMGDALSGIIASLIAQGMAPNTAAKLGVCLHAQAADDAAALHGERGLLASNVIAQLQGIINAT